MFQRRMAAADEVLLYTIHPRSESTLIKYCIIQYIKGCRRVGKAEQGKSGTEAVTGTETPGGVERKENRL